MFAPPTTTAATDSSSSPKPATKVGLVHFASLEDISHFFTDDDISTEFIEQMRAADVNLMICGENTVRSHTVSGNLPQYTLGFANESEELPFAVEVRRGLEQAAAAQNNIDLVIADNKLSGKEALRVADKLIARNVDLVIEYQIDHKAGGLLMDKFQQANIPVIALDIPMVGATFFGVDNYRAGHVAIAVLSFNTDAVMGALRAARRLGREQDVAIVGQGADRLLLDEIQQPGSRVIGATSYMPERYGEQLIKLALKILQGEPAPPTVYTEHIFLNKDNINSFYPKTAVIEQTHRIN